MKAATYLTLFISIFFCSLASGQSTGFFTDFEDALKHPENVRVLDLSHRELKAVPDTFEIFTQLQELRLGYNNLKNLPKSLAKVKSLTSVILTGNINLDIEQSIRVLAAIPNLENLNLSNCGIMFLPGAISGCDSLRWLSLEANQILFLPNSFGRLYRLESLNLNNNHISSLPPSFIQLQRLSILQMAANEPLNIELTVESLSKLKLKELHLGGQSVIDDLNRIKSLRRLTIEGCSFTTTPDFSSTQLKELTINNCQGIDVDSLIMSVAQVDSLIKFSIIDYNLTAINFRPLYDSKIQVLKVELPGITNWNSTLYPFTRMTKLYSLDLSGNEIVEVPAGLNRCETLTHLNLNQNGIGSDILSLKNQNIEFLNLQLNEIEKGEIATLVQNLPNCKIRHDFMYNQPMAKQIPHPDLKPKIETFEWQGEQPKVIVLQSGTKLEIPENAFVTASGKPIAGDVKLNIEEFKTAGEIFASGIPMTYDSAGTTYDFKSGGMMEIRAFQNEQELALAPGKLINAEMTTSSTENFNVYNLNDTTGAWALASTGASPSTRLVRSDTTGYQFLDSLAWYNANSRWYYPPKEVMTFSVKRYPKLNSFVISVDKRKPRGRNFEDKNYPEAPLLDDYDLLYEGQNAVADLRLLQTVIDTLDEHYNLSSKNSHYPVHVNSMYTGAEILTDFYLKENPESDNFILTIIFKGEIIEMPVALNTKRNNPKALQKQYSKFYSRYYKTQQKRVVSWNESDSIYESRRRIALESQWNALTATAIYRNGRMYIPRPALGFSIGGLGIVNCDVPLPVIPENPKVIARAKYRSPDNGLVKAPYVTYVLDYTNNAAYRYREGVSPSIYKNSYSVIIIDLAGSRKMGLIRFNQIKEALDNEDKRPVFEYEEFRNMEALMNSLEENTVSID